MREGLQWKARNEGWVVRGGEDLERKARPAGARPIKSHAKIRSPVQAPNITTTDCSPKIFRNFIDPRVTITKSRGFPA
jgi:hypothetical protein